MKWVRVDITAEEKQLLHHISLADDYLDGDHIARTGVLNGPSHFVVVVVFDFKWYDLTLTLSAI